MKFFYKLVMISSCISIGYAQGTSNVTVAQLLFAQVVIAQEMNNRVAPSISPEQKRHLMSSQKKRRTDIHTQPARDKKGKQQYAHFPKKYSRKK